MALKLLSQAPRPQARAALADAIATLAELQREGAALATARTTAMESISTARRGVQAAQERLEDAKGDAVRQAVDAAMGQSAEVALTVPAARRAITDAEDALEIARAALTGIDTRIAQNQTSTSFASDSVKASALIVLRDAPAIADAAARAEQAQRDMVQANAALQWLLGKGLTQDGKAAVGRFNYLTQSGLGRAPEVWGPLVQETSVDGEGPWHGALTALLTNPDAPLP